MGFVGVSSVSDASVYSARRTVKCGARREEVLAGKSFITRATRPHLFVRKRAARTVVRCASSGDDEELKLKTDEVYIAQLLAVCVGAAAAASAAGVKPPLPLFFPPLLSAITLLKKPIRSFDQLKSRSSMNTDLVASTAIVGSCSPGPRKNASVYNVSKYDLKQAFFKAIRSSSPRTVLAFRDPDSMTYGLVQRSLLMQFPDLITVQFVDGEEGADTSSIAIFSSSIFGAGDLGVNAKRVDSWLALLDGELKKRA
mmetsp:Transcript_8601/g.18364  ORF Transcript_8601/g.18364 Transcript_8601/m.18364 type:complete len:255 (+) Transcript_8601:44-808(+)